MNIKPHNWRLRSALEFNGCSLWVALPKTTLVKQLYSLLKRQELAASIKLEKAIARLNKAKPNTIISNCDPNLAITFCR